MSQSPTRPRALWNPSMATNDDDGGESVEDPTTCDDWFHQTLDNLPFDDDTAPMSVSRHPTTRHPTTRHPTAGRDLKRPAMVVGGGMVLLGATLAALALA